MCLDSLEFCMSIYLYTPSPVSSCLIYMSWISHRLISRHIIRALLGSSLKFAVGDICPSLNTIVTMFRRGFLPLLYQYLLAKVGFVCTESFTYAWLLKTKAGVDLSIGYSVRPVPPFTKALSKTWSLPIFHFVLKDQQESLLSLLS